MKIRREIHDTMMSYADVDDNGNIILSNENYDKLVDLITNKIKTCFDRERLLIDLFEQLKQNNENNQRVIQKVDQVVNTIKKDYDDDTTNK